MEFIEQLKKEHILIVGLGLKTGLSVANYLLSKDINNISISDSKTKDELYNLISKLIKPVKHIYCGKQGDYQLTNVDRIILSPGVARSIPLIQKAVESNIPITSEIELAYLLCNPKLIIGITGTDGKTTTTSIVHRIIEQEMKVKVGGNIGIPFISVVDDVDENTIVVLELSSYQLEDVQRLNCNIAAILNISEDHLDRYNNFNEYINAKKNILKNQSESDIIILNYDDPYYKKLSSNIKSKLYTFSKDNQNQTAYIKSSCIYFMTEKVISIDKIKLKGIHNIENILASICIAKLLGISNKSIEKVLMEFSGLENRNEFVKKVNGISFINDSKATTVNSVIKSLLSYDKGIILIMGGQDKGLDFSKLIPFMDNRVKLLILMGEAKTKINKAINFYNTKLVSDLEQAFYTAVNHAKNNDVILLSPGCASFDLYKNYEERGSHFKKLVYNL